MDLAVQNAGVLAVSDEVFGADFNEALIHQVVKAYINTARSGTKAQKNRAAVRGGGAKPWRQKGTGQSRAGTSSSPIWRSGGVTFAAEPRDYSQKVNRKMYRAAIRSILSELVRQQRLILVEDLKIGDKPQTKALVAWLNELDVEIEDALIVVDQLDETLVLSARNLYHIDVRDHTDIDPPSLIGFDKVIITTAALEKIGERLA